MGETVNKNEYLNQLRKELSGLANSDIEDIIRDQDEYLRDAMSSGREESQVIVSMGSPSQLAKELKAEYQIKAATEEKKVLPKAKIVFKAILALCVLAPFNLLFVLGPFVLLCAILVAIWAVDVSSVIGALAIIVVSVVAVASVGPLVGATAFFAGITLLGLSILFACFMVVITGWILKMTVSFLKWNIQFVTDQAK